MILIIYVIFPFHFDFKIHVGPSRKEKHAEMKTGMVAALKWCKLMSNTKKIAFDLQLQQALD